MGHAYVVGQSGGIAPFSLYADGSIRRAAPNLQTGAGSFGIIPSPDTKSLYVFPGLGLGTSYSLTQPPQAVTLHVGGSGKLRTVSTQALDPALTAVTAAFSHDGRDMYVGVGAGVAGFTNGGIQHFVVGRNGVPTPQGAPTPMGQLNDGAAEPIVSPDGRWLYVASYMASAIVRFRIYPDGSLSTSPVDRFPSGYAPITPTLSPDGRFLYVANELDMTITGFAIEADGSLTPIPGSPFASGAVPHNFAFADGGKYLYSANTAGASFAGLETGDGSVSGFAVQSNGALTPLPGSPYKSLPGPVMVNVSPDDGWLYVTSSPQSASSDKPVALTSYAIRQDGTLDPAAHESVLTGQNVADGPETVVLPAARR